MAANGLEIVWRNPQPVGARPVEQVAGPLELVKGPESQGEQVSKGWSAFLLFASAGRS
jgi:hypothetical protein